MGKKRALAKPCPLMHGDPGASAGISPGAATVCAATFDMLDYRSAFINNTDCGIDIDNNLQFALPLKTSLYSAAFSANAPVFLLGLFKRVCA